MHTEHPFKLGIAGQSMYYTWCICIIITCTVSSVVTTLVEFSSLAVAGPDLADHMDKIGKKHPTAFVLVLTGLDGCQQV